MRAADWCLSAAGAALVMATSSDPRHPAGNVADGSSETFWTTTGMFPQEFIIGFPKRVTVSRVAIQCYLVRTLRIERSVSKDPVDFEECIEKGIPISLQKFLVTLYCRVVLAVRFATHRRTASNGRVSTS
ncbi:intraflagellar transport protein 25 homolog isoform X2 [Tympanuchus pallidicinctus]|uniref:intraflagellar transport protein 25 homolog isoform X2 n=1 Tax=Tympanuchus pallidicinctus TaxID=109042 RepID=UPI0022875A8A|nr:intraflagellar transport protein 25 homolog isoform X2 [Tympanuchus pallidicinctus]